MPVYNLYSKKCEKVFVTFPKCACTTLIKWVATIDGIAEQFGISYENNDVVGYSNIHEFGHRYLSVRIGVKTGEVGSAKSLFDGIKSVARGLVRMNEQHVPGGKVVLKDYADIFVVSRSPYSRLLSCYLGNYGDTRWGLRQKYGALFNGDFTFSQFVDALYDNRIHVDSDEHFKPLTNFFDGNFLENVGRMSLIRFDALNARLQSIGDTVGAKFGYERVINRTRYEPEYSRALYDISGNKLIKRRSEGGVSVRGGLQCFYNDEIKEKVEAIYARDFEVFNIPNEIGSE